MGDYNSLPRDKDNAALQEFPAPIKAKQAWLSENATASSILLLSHDTTHLEVTAIGIGSVAAAIRWIGPSGQASVAGASSVVAIAGATANFDHIIPAGTMRRFAIPIESNPDSRSVMGVNRARGLYQRVAWKTLGIASVAANEY